jgi:uncharacterized protein YacL
MSLWVIRIFFLSLCMLAGLAVSQLHNALIAHWGLGLLIGFGLGSCLIAIDEMIKGFSLRAFSAATFGLVFGSIIAWLVDRSELFEWAAPDVRWLIRICLFLGFGYIGIILAMRSNKEDFSLIIPYVRFASQTKPENPLVLDTSAIIDGRVVELIESNFLEGLIIVPQFVLRELQSIADSPDPIRRARGRRGLEMLNRIQRNTRMEVKIHEGDFPEETQVDAKLVRLSRLLGAKLFTTDYNLGKVAEIQSVRHVNIAEVATRMKPAILPGEMLTLRLVREGREKGQGIAYLNDGTMVVVNNGQSLIGQQAQVEVASLVQTGAGVIVFADVKGPAAAPARPAAG